jgi:predicted RNase H-like nuclease
LVAGAAARVDPVLTWAIRGGALTTHDAPIDIEALRNELLVTVDALQRRRADLVSEALIASYIALYWMEWNGGTLRLTQTGKNVCDQLRAASRAP